MKLNAEKIESKLGNGVSQLQTHFGGKGLPHLETCNGLTAEYPATSTVFYVGAYAVTRYAETDLKY